MMMKKLALAGLVAASPSFVMAQSIAASLSASFGAADDAVTGDFVVDGPEGTVTIPFIAPTNIATAASTGVFAAATSVSTS